MFYIDTMNNPRDIERDADSYELQHVLARARRAMTPEQATRLDTHLKNLMDRLSHEDGTPRPFKPNTPDTSE